MIVRQKNNIFYYGTFLGGPECRWVKDCTKREEAKDLWDKAKKKRENAEKLLGELAKEKEKAAELLENSKGVYDLFADCGGTIASPSNMGPGNGMTSIINCVSKYGAAVEQAYNDCQTEYDQCVIDEENAKNTYDNTPCEDKCI